MLSDKEYKKYQRAAFNQSIGSMLRVSNRPTAKPFDSTELT